MNLIGSNARRFWCRNCFPQHCWDYVFSLMNIQEIWITARDEEKQGYKLCHFLQNFTEFIASKQRCHINTIMIKQVMIAIVLTSLLIGNAWDAEARERAAAVRPEKIVDFAAQSESKVREKRFINPFSGLLSVWNAITHIYSLYADVSYLCVIISLLRF